MDLSRRHELVFCRGSNPLSGSGGMTLRKSALCLHSWRLLQACFCVMCPFFTSCRTLSRSRSFAVIHSPSPVSAMTYQSGTFYFAERGTSHIAATVGNFQLTRIHSQAHNSAVHSFRNNRS